MIITTKVELLEALCNEFSVEVPRAVFNETVIDGKADQKTDAFLIEEAISDGKISVRETALPPGSKALRWLDELNLGDGEKEAIMLYIQDKAGLLLVDDRQGIKAARLLGINWASVPALIIELAKTKKIDGEKAIAAMKKAQEFGRYKFELMILAYNELEKMR